MAHEIRHALQLWGEHALNRGCFYAVVLLLKFCSVIDHAALPFGAVVTGIWIGKMGPTYCAKCLGGILGAFVHGFLTAHSGG